MHDPMAVQGICLGLLMLSAHLFGRLALKLHLGQMIGQLVGGVLVGPYFLETIGVLEYLHVDGYEAAFEHFHFIIFTFLGVIAFALGEELHFERMRAIGAKSALISLIQAGITWVCLTSLFLFVVDWPIALVIGSIGVATAPAITFVLLNSLEIEGRFRNMVANILVLDDVLEVILFSIFVQIAAKIHHGGGVNLFEITRHLFQEFGLAMLLGLLVFIILKVAVRTRPAPNDPETMATLGPGFVSRILSAHPTPSVEVLVVVIGTVAVASGIGLGLHLPFLVIGVFAGVLVANLHSHALFDSLKIDNVMPLLNLVFFAMIGANIHFDVFHWDNLWMVGAYVIARGFGKLFGTWFGCKVTKQDPKVIAALPFLMLPQAGVAAVEAVYVVKLLGGEGRIVADVVLPALVIFEITGVFLSERTLLKWRMWTMGEAEVLSLRDKIIRETFHKESPALEALQEFIPPGRTGTLLEADTLPGAIRELAEGLKDDGVVTDVDAVVERSLAREKMGATAIGGGVCLPHSKLLGYPQTTCSVGVLKQPLKAVEGPDGLPIETVILLISPIEKPEEHLRALALIARIYSDTAFREHFVDEVRQSTPSG